MDEAVYCTYHRHQGSVALATISGRRRLKRSEWLSFADASILYQPSIARVEDWEPMFSTQNQSIHLQRRKMQIYVQVV